MALRKIAIYNVDLVDRRVLIRVDYDVPMEGGKVTNTEKIEASLETIEYALDHKCKSVVLMSHLGKPDGIRDMQFSLAPVADVLEELLEREVTFLDDCVGPTVEIACSDPKPGSVILLENLQFHLEEIGETEDQQVQAESLDITRYRESLRGLADVYVNDAFSLAHLAHSSILGEGFEVLAQGFSFRKEWQASQKITEEEKRPFLAIVGGAKAVNKLQYIDKMLDKVDEMIIGGAVAFTFLKEIEEMEVGDSLYNKGVEKQIKEIMSKAGRKNVKIHFPVDFVTGDELEEDAEVGEATVESGIPDGNMGLDIGPESIENFKEVIERAKLIVWNGTMGVFEWENFSNGTKCIMDAIVEANENGATTSIGEGDTVEACQKWEAEDKVSNIGEEGETFLLTEEDLPGVSVLTDRREPCACHSQKIKEKTKEENNSQKNEENAQEEYDPVMNIGNTNEKRKSQENQENTKEKMNSQMNIGNTKENRKSLGNKGNTNEKRNSQMNKENGKEKRNSQMNKENTKEKRNSQMNKENTTEKRNSQMDKENTKEKRKSQNIK